MRSSVAVTPDFARYSASQGGPRILDLGCGDGARAIALASSGFLRVAESDIGANSGADRRLRDVLQVIDGVQSQDFFLSLHHRGAPAQPIRLGRLRGQVQRFIDGLDYDAVVAGFAAGRPAPLFSFEEHGLILRITVVP